MRIIVTYNEDINKYLLYLLYKGEVITRIFIKDLQQGL